MEQVKIQENTINLTNGRKGQIAILSYFGDDPVAKLEKAVAEYVGDVAYTELVDINMDNPWVRVVISGINEMDKKDFDPSEYKLKLW